MSFRWFSMMTKLNSGLIILLLCGLSSALANVSGSNVDKPGSKSIAALEAQAAAGSDKAQMRLGVIYLQGRGVTADIDKALYYYRMAAERKIAFAQLKLAKIYLDGKYIEADPQKALSWLLRSARQGFIPAQLYLSKLYENGTFVDRDLVKAHQWITIASSLTDTDLGPRRETLEEKMTFTEVAYARFRSRICILNGYEDC